MTEKLYVIAVISNPTQFESRYNLYREFEAYMLWHNNVELYVVEHAFKDRPHIVTNSGNDKHIQVRGNQEFWLKENLINIALNRLPKSAKKVAWIDADIRFTNPNWVQSTLDELNHYKFVQMFSECIDLGPDYQLISTFRSFMEVYKNNSEPILGNYNNPIKGATGLAWAANLDILEEIGGIPDFNIVGSGDWFLAYALIGLGHLVIPDWSTRGYRYLLESLISRCEDYVCQNVGYIKGTVMHYFHGKKTKRGYDWREGILNRHKFDPLLDLTKDSQGLYIVNRNKVGMLTDLTNYFISRDEDSKEV